MKHEKRTKTIDGIHVLTLGRAIQKIRTSEGIPVKQLAQDAGISINTLYDLSRESSPSDKVAYAVVKALAESTKLGIKTPADVIARADEIPELTFESVTKALVALARSQGLSQFELKEKTLQKFPLAVNEGMRMQGDFEAAYYQAKTLGCSSIGDLLLKSAKLPPDIEDAILIPAVEALREARNISKPDFAEKIGIGRSTYSIAVQHKRLAFKAKGKLPAAFGLNSLQDIINEAAKLEPLPDISRKAAQEAASGAVPENPGKPGSSWRGRSLLPPRGGRQH